MDRFELRWQDFTLDRDQVAVRDAFAEFFAKECPTSVVRAAEPLGFDPGLWGRLTQMGVAAMSLPASAGGDDATLVDLALVLEECGRAAAPVPLVSHVVTTRLLARAGVPDDVLAAVASGERLVTFAHAPVVDGARTLVPDAAVAKDVVALRDGVLELYTADRPRPHVRNQGSTPLAWWSPGEHPSRTELATGEDAADLHRIAVAEWRLLTAAALVGATEAALHLGVEFAKTRRTLGVPIGTLQGVSFPLADVAIAVSGARNLVWKAAWFAENEPSVRPELPFLAFDAAVRTATRGTTTAAHVHGGLGFSVEADVSLFFLRAKGWGLLGGDLSQNLRDAGAIVAQL
jgi:alkylation response protein AidB-like acyl-CoA dehydrogenase